jgi:hypothetical protein
LQWGDFIYYTVADLSGDDTRKTYYNIEAPLVEYLKAGVLKGKKVTVAKASHHGSDHSSYPAYENAATKPGSSGDADTHTHKISNGAGTTDNAPDHVHLTNDQSWYRRWLQMYYESAENDNNKDYFKYTMIDCNNCDVRVSKTQNAGNHSHKVTIGEQTLSASAGANRPAWYALCYIMKL